MDWTLEVVVVPVADIDRAKVFYVDRMGFHLDVDAQVTPALRVVQMTPPGSSCSVTVGPVLLEPGMERTPSASLQFVVNDIEAARDELMARGVDAGEVQVLDPRDGGKFLFFTDPDGNNLAIQEMRERIGAEL